MNGNGKRIFWIAISSIVALIGGLALFSGRTIIGNNRELGEQDIRIETNKENIKENKEQVVEIRESMSDLKAGQKVLIEKFELEKEYQEKLKEIVK